MNPLRAVLLAAAAALAGCPAEDAANGLAPTPPDQLLDYNKFVCDVMPTLIRRCSYLACHGRSDHALRVYAPGKLRLAAVMTRNDRDAPLSADELELDFESASGLVLSATPDERAQADLNHVLLLQKPLAARFGGGEHHGIAIFPVYPAATPDADGEWTQLVAWVGGATQKPPAPACAAFFTALGAQPR